MHEHERSAARTSPAFFNRPQTARTIVDIAQANELVLYVGAGVTISESGASWDSLMRHLALSLDKDVDADQLERLIKTLPTLQLASVIWHHYTRKFRDRAGSQLADAISSFIYRTNQWRSGDYSAATTLLCTTFANSGADVAVFTTNYDTYLEQAADRLRLEVSSDIINFDGIVRVSDSEADEVSEFPEYVAPRDGEAHATVTHLHGVIEERSTVSVSTPVVFSEVDYQLTQDDVVGELSRAFDGKSVLILGSGLDDSPLLRALARTHGRRWAVVPRAAAPKALKAFDAERAGEADDIMGQLAARAKLFDVDLIVPDFFGQAGQFVREVARARQLADAGRTYSAKPTDYNRRLQAWWEKWQARNLTKMPDRQRRAALQLRKALEVVKDLAGDLDERMKIEMWVRWKPDGRHLQLWASSTGTWPDSTTARRIPIEQGSNYACVEAFVKGEVLLSPTGGRSDRWETYFAVPLRTSETVDSQVLGVITLATANNNGHTKLAETYPAELDGLGRYLRAVGQRLLAT